MNFEIADPSYLDYLQQYAKMTSGDRSKVIPQEQQDQERALRVQMYASMSPSMRASAYANESRAAWETPSFGWQEGQPLQSTGAVDRVKSFYSDVDAEIAKRKTVQQSQTPVAAVESAQPVQQVSVQQTQQAAPNLTGTWQPTQTLASLLPNQQQQQTGTLADLYRDPNTTKQNKPWWQV